MTIKIKIHLRKIQLIIVKQRPQVNFFIFVIKNIWRKKGNFMHYRAGENFKLQIKSLLIFCSLQGHTEVYVFFLVKMNHIPYIVDQDAAFNFQIFMTHMVSNDPMSISYGKTINKSNEILNKLTV